MEHLYHGSFSHEQINSEKKSLHSKIHWLLIYKEEEYPMLDMYFSNLIDYLCSLNYVLSEPPELVSLVVLLNQARSENQKGEQCNFKKYRKLILDAHSLLDNFVENNEC